VVDVVGGFGCEIESGSFDAFAVANHRGMMPAPEHQEGEQRKSTVRGSASIIDARRVSVLLSDLRFVGKFTFCVRSRQFSQRGRGEVSIFSLLHGSEPSRCLRS
jgi:hypothetical protein